MNLLSVKLTNGTDADMRNQVYCIGLLNELQRLIETA